MLISFFFSPRLFCASLLSPTYSHTYLPTLSYVRVYLCAYVSFYLALSLSLSQLSRVFLIFHIMSCLRPGLGIVVFSDFVFLWACWVRCQKWGFCVTLYADRPLVTSGPYRWLRHPMYVAWMTYIPGLALACGDWIFPFSLLLRLCYNLFHLSQEEEMLAAQYGDEYRRYCSQTPRFCPCFSDRDSSVGSTQLQYQQLHVPGERE